MFWKFFLELGNFLFLVIKRAITGTKWEKNFLLISRVKGTNMGHGTNMGSSLFSVSKKHYLLETIRNIQREQKKNI